MRAILPAIALILAGCTTLQPSAPPRQLTVLVYNIHAGKDAAAADNLARVAALVRETGADIALLQEVDSMTQRSGRVDQLAELRRMTGFHAAFGSTLPYQGGGYGIAVLSRHPIRAHRLIPLPNDPPQPRAGGSREPRGALHAEVETPSGVLHVLNTHIDASGDDRWRRQEATRLVAVADSIRATGARVLVGGDMNSTPESAVQEIVRAAALHDAWTMCGGGQEMTYPAATPVKRIDYLYLTGAMQCSGARVLDTQASDHRPVLVHVQVAP